MSYQELKVFLRDWFKEFFLTPFRIIKKPFKRTQNKFLYLILWFFLFVFLITYIFSKRLWNVIVCLILLAIIRMIKDYDSGDWRTRCYESARKKN